MRATYLLIARIPPGRLEPFMQYEDRVLPLLEEHGGKVEVRVRTHDERVEVHLVSFPSPMAFAAYRDDPRRALHRQLLRESQATTELLGVFDVLPPASGSEVLPRRGICEVRMTEAAQ